MHTLMGVPKLGATTPLGLGLEEKHRQEQLKAQLNSTKAHKSTTIGIRFNK